MTQNFKLSGKKISWNIFNLIINDRPYSIELQTKEEVEELTELIKQSVKGDKTSQENLLKRVLKDETQKMEIASKLTKSKNSHEEIKSTKEKISRNKNILETENKSRSRVKGLSDKEKEILQSHGLLVGEGGSYFLAPFKGELPETLAVKMIDSILQEKSIQHLKSFWSETLLNENKEARMDLFKYLSKQKLINTSTGLFETFRRVLRVNKQSLNFNKSATSSSNPDQNTTELSSNTILWEHKETILEFVAKVKKWRKGLRSFEVYTQKDDKDVLELLLKPIKDHEGNQSKYGRALGTLHDCNEVVTLQEELSSPEITSTTESTISEKIQSKYSQEVFTDAHTRTMVIRMGEPVRMDRSKCNSNSRVECSFGLHVGTPSFVKGGSGFGSVIVMCIVNPRHVISVPYSDAHKMRVCEYFPVKEITLDELIDFDLKEIDEFVSDYKAIEDEKIMNAFDVENVLTEEQKQMFRISKLTDQEYEKLVKDLENDEKEFKKIKRSFEVTTKDSVSSDLKSDEFLEILKNRLVKN